MSKIKLHTESLPEIIYPKPKILLIDVDSGAVNALR